MQILLQQRGLINNSYVNYTHKTTLNTHTTPPTPPQDFTSHTRTKASEARVWAVTAGQWLHDKQGEVQARSSERGMEWFGKLLGEFVT